LCYRQRHEPSPKTWLVIGVGTLVRSILASITKSLVNGLMYLMVHYISPQWDNLFSQSLMKDGLANILISP
jgi:hypothetical protein